MTSQVFSRGPLSPRPRNWICPRAAADTVMARCRQKHGFQTEHEFWAEFGHIYAEVESTVRPDQRFAFATRVDGHLAGMGLAPWSIMSRLALAVSGEGQAPAIL